MTLRALIFDVDGTLAETERDGHRVAFNRAFADAGLPWNWSVARYGELLRVAGGRERLRYYIGSDHPQICGAACDALIRAVHERKTEHYVDVVRNGATPLRLGVARLLAAAQAEGLRLAIATTTSRANVDALLAHQLPRSLRFDVIAAAEDAPRKKPDPQVFLVALERLGLSARECLAFEDSPAGLRAALAADLRTIVTTNAYTCGQEFTGAFCVLDGLGEAQAAARVTMGPALLDSCVDVAQLHAWARDPPGGSHPAR